MYRLKSSVWLNALMIADIAVLILFVLWGYLAWRNPKKKKQ